jgi:hypothetical protein
VLRLVHIRWHNFSLWVLALASIAPTVIWRSGGRALSTKSDVRFWMGTEREFQELAFARVSARGTLIFEISEISLKASKLLKQKFSYCIRAQGAKKVF